LYRAMAYSKGKGYGKGKQSEYLDYCVSRVDPADRGDLPEHLLPLSRKLAQRLRYKASYLRSQGIVMDQNGWVQVTEVLADMEGFDVQDLRQVVKESYSKDQPRFETREQDGRLQIRAAHKRPEPRVPRGERVQSRREATPEPPEVEEAYEELVPTAGKRNKMRGLEPEHFDISEDPGDEPGELPECLSTCHVEWSRFELHDGVFAWWCSRDGEEDGFVEVNPDPWDLMMPDELEDLERPCWFNRETGEYFFISQDDADSLRKTLADVDSLQAALMHLKLEATSAEKSVATFAHFTPEVTC